MNAQSLFARNRGQGFTLIEAMIVVAVISILAAVAIPSYTQYIVRANRSAAQSFMFSLANKEEQFLLDARRFYCTAPNTCTNVITLTIPSEVSNNYSVTVAAPDTAGSPSYTITAAPINGQVKDTKCGTVTLTQDGTKGKSGTSTVADCWK